MSFSIPKQGPALLNAQTPAFESPDNTRSSTQPMASNDTPLPLNTESISHVGSPTGSPASWESSRSQSTAQITNDTQKTGSNLSSLAQSLHAVGSSRNVSIMSASSTAHLKSATPSVFQKEALSQSIHAAPMETSSKHQPTTGDPKIVRKVENVDSSKRSTFISSSKPQARSSSGGLGGIMRSIYATPENHKPTR